MIHKQNQIKMEEEVEKMVEDMEKVKQTMKARIEEFGEDFPSPSAPRIYLDQVDGDFGSRRSLSSLKSSEDSPDPFRKRIGSSTLSCTSSLVVEHDSKDISEEDEESKNSTNDSYKSANDDEDDAV